MTDRLLVSKVADVLGIESIDRSRCLSARKRFDRHLASSGTRLHDFVSVLQDDLLFFGFENAQFDVQIVFAHEIETQT